MGLVTTEDFKFILPEVVKPATNSGPGFTKVTLEAAVLDIVSCKKCSEVHPTRTYRNWKQNVRKKTSSFFSRPLPCWRRYTRFNESGFRPSGAASDIEENKVGQWPSSNQTKLTKRTTRRVWIANTTNAVIMARPF